MSDMCEQYLDLSVAPPDTAFGLMADFDEDPHPSKVSLIAGAYRDEYGSPWVLPSVQEVCTRLPLNPLKLTSVQAKSRLGHQNHEYLSIAGSPTFLSLARLLTFGTELSSTLDKNIASIQTVSGTGANHIAALFLARHMRPAHVFIPSPTWVNHHAIWAQTGVARVNYPYYAPKSRSVDLDGMLSVLDDKAEPNDILVLQACAHNPTGVDLTRVQWAQVVDVVKRKKLCVVFDSAYQGFATGDPDDDAWAIRYFTEELIDVHQSECPGLYIAQSFSKNFGLYGERVGALHLVVPRHLSPQGALSNWELLARAEYSNPPRFGARIVETVLADDQLRSQWKKDLVTMSSRIKKMRCSLRRRLEEQDVPGNWSHIENQIGMFSYTGLDSAMVTRLRTEFHIYLLPSGRASICGLNEENVDYVARAIGQVVRQVTGLE
jgi:aspartate aminotransferase